MSYAILLEFKSLVEMAVDVIHHHHHLLLGSFPMVCTDKISDIGFVLVQPLQ